MTPDLSEVITARYRPYSRAHGRKAIAREYGIHPDAVTRLAGPRVTWTPDRVIALKRLVALGRTCRDMAEELHLSPKAVRSKCARLGLKPRIDDWQRAEAIAAAQARAWADPVRRARRMSKGELT